MKTTEDKIKSEVKKFQDLETKLLTLQSSLSKNKEFQQFLRLQSTVNTKAEEVWSFVEETMIDNDLVGPDNSIDADWVKLTIVQKPKIDVVGDIPAEFTKSVPDTKKINAYIKDTGEIPEGIKKSTTKYLRKTFRSLVS